MKTPFKRTLAAGVLACLALTAQKPAAKLSALDKATMEVWIRHLFVWPAPIEVSIAEPKPGPCPISMR